MDWVSPQAQETARLRAQTSLIRKKRYRGMISLMLGFAGLGADLAGFPLSLSVALWALGLGAWFVIKRTE